MEGIPVRKLTLIALMLLAAVSLAACGKKSADSTTTPAASSNTKNVSIHVFAFDPNPITVKAGTMVKWTNKDDILHTVTSGTRDHANGAFNAKLDGPNTSFATKFSKA